MARTALLGYALLGLLAGKPSTGYDLRKLFTGTPMRHFSDSPGSVYPALRRLEDAGHVRIAKERDDNPRGRQRYVPTRAGLTEFRRWLASPVEQDEIDRPGEFVLRFAFMDDHLVHGEIVARLTEFRERIRAYAADLRQTESSLAPKLPACARLALQNGIQSHDAQADWADRALSQLDSVKGRT